MTDVTVSEQTIMLFQGVSIVGDTVSVKCAMGNEYRKVEGSESERVAYFSLILSYLTLHI